MLTTATLLQPTAKVRAPLEALSDDGLDHFEALYLRLLRLQPPASPITQQLHRKLCEVRLAMFERA